MLHLREGMHKTTTSILRKQSDVGHQEMLLLYTEANVKVLLSHPLCCDSLINNLAYSILYIFWNKILFIFISVSQWKVSAGFPHLLLASLEPSESWHLALLLQTQRKFDPLPGLGPPHPAHPPGSWCSAPCAAGAPEGQPGETTHAVKSTLSIS